VTQIGRLEQERKKAAGELENLTHRRRTIGFEFLKPARTGRTVVEIEGLRLVRGRQAAPRRRLARDRAPASTSPRGAERLGKTTLLETLVGNRAPDAGVVRFGTASSRRTSPSTRSSWTSAHGARLRGGDDRARPAQAQNLLGKFLFSATRSRRSRSGALGRRAAAARPRGDRRLGRQLPRARRADEPPRPREREALEDGARGVPGLDPARLPRPGRPRRRRRAHGSRVEGHTLHSYDGGWAEPRAGA